MPPQLRLAAVAGVDAPGEGGCDNVELGFEAGVVTAWLAAVHQVPDGAVPLLPGCLDLRGLGGADGPGGRSSARLT